MSFENISSFAFENQNINKVIIPVGSYEQHGLHAALGTDYLIADKIAQLISEKAGIYKLPPVVYGCSALHLGHKGTISIKTDTFEAYISDIIESLIKSGVKKVFIVNGHGGNILSLNKVKENYNKVDITILNWWIIGKNLHLFYDHEMHHAGSLETSVLLAVDEKYVNKENFVDTDIVEYDPYHVNYIDEITPTGSIGTVTTASKNRGELYLAELINCIVNNYL